jgi:hypothetical protein
MKKTIGMKWLSKHGVVIEEKHKAPRKAKLHKRGEGEGKHHASNTGHKHLAGRSYAQQKAFDLMTGTPLKVTRKSSKAQAREAARQNFSLKPAGE